MEVRQAVLLTGGLAKRLGSITRVTNKHLLPVYDKPIVFHGLDLLRNCGISDVTIVLGGNSVGDIVNLVKDGSEFGLHVTYVYQKEAKGISQAIALTEKTLSRGKFIVLLGDNVFDDIGSIKEGIDTFYSGWVQRPGLTYYTGFESFIVLVESESPQNYGQPVFNKHGGIVGFVEKTEYPAHNSIVAGLYGLNTSVFDIIKSQGFSARGELEITDTLKHCLNNMEVINHRGFWTDCGTPEGLSEASEHFRRRLESVVKAS